MTHTEFATTIANIIKDLFSKFDDKHAKEDAKVKENIEETIS